MNEQSSLSTLSKGREAKIVKIGPTISGPQRRRLLDLGVVPGVKVKHRIDSPGGDPRAFEIMESVIALRKEQTDHIFIKREE